MAQKVTVVYKEKKENDSFVVICRDKNFDPENFSSFIGSEITLNNETWRVVDHEQFDLDNVFQSLNVWVERVNKPS